MTVIDTVNRVFREFKRYTGDGLPGEPTGASLPIGDPASGPNSPKKSEIRTALTEVLEDAAASAALAQEWAEAAEEVAIPDAFTLGVTGAVSSLAALRGLSTTRYASAELYGASGLSGHFSWFASDLSATMVNRTVTSTGVNSTTEVVTSAAHQLDTANVVIATTAVNGLSLNTPYYVNRIDADTFKLYDTYANAVAGGPTGLVNFTGTTNFTVKRLSDPLAGVYVVPTGLALDGSAGAWVRRHNKTLDVRWFGATGDGVTDDRQAIMAAFECASAINGSVHVPGGTWAFNGEIYVYRLTPLLTDGADKTVFKNLSATGRGLYFERHGSFGPLAAPAALNTSFIRLDGGFTLDQNNSTGDGLTLRAQHTTTAGQIRIRNQGAGGFSCRIDGATLCDIEYLALTTCKWGLKIKDCYYPRIAKFAGEVTAGDVLNIDTSTSVQFDDCYIDPGSTSDPRVQLAQVVNCTDVTFTKLTAELDNSGSYSADGLFVVENTVGFTVHAGRALIGANAYTVTNDKAFFLLLGTSYSPMINQFNIRKGGGTNSFMFVRATSAAANQHNNITLSSITTDLGNSGGKYLFYTDTYSVKRLNIETVHDYALASQIYYRGQNVLISQFDGAIANEGSADGGGASTTLINCPGTKTGLASAIRLNST